ncbi:PREDICTED: dual specificity protein phosphatase 8 [Dipodomys ordii]|uniref:protein-tyrosine-phosphatase n=1 Tax=Dipodomys ordii TaxID=10020 RepID=A0A1S3GJD0_DIPOR|nr:PREDICTED: dual specificity protein phosphatase 8 [Dipodomys ordii]
MAGDRLPRKVMDAKKLASLLRGGPGGPLVIDSRSFVEYNSWHVLSSVNICCSKLVKRRLQQGKVSIAELIQPAVRSQVETTEPQDVVVYDQSTRDASVLAADSFLSILLSKLDGCFDSVAILMGGFATFSSCFPGLCEGKPAALPSMSLSQPCLPVPSVGLTRILPHLYLGSQKDVLNKDLMTQNGISYVLNASNSCPKPDFICESRFMRIPINDNYCEKLLPWLDKSIEFIGEEAEPRDVRTGWAEEPGPEAQFKRRSCQMEFEEGMAEGRARSEELAALGKQASFSGSVEVIEVS